MNTSRGEVVLVLYPNSSLTGAKRRPGLVVQAANLNTRLPQTIVAMITSNMSRANHPCRVTVASNTPAGRQSGLSLDSVVMLDNIATVSDRQIRQVIGSLPDMKMVDEAIKHTLGL